MTEWLKEEECANRWYVPKGVSVSDTSLECRRCLASPSRTPLTQQFEPQTAHFTNPKFYKYLPPSFLSTVPPAGKAIIKSEPWCLQDMDNFDFES
jgi:hypothetical protein